MSVSKSRVLIVDDEDAQREVLAYTLSADGFEVSQAKDGEEALLMIRETPPDAMILDWMMPNVSGIEVCRRLRAHTSGQKIPIIMLSARSEDAQKIRALEIGADDYVVKPYSLAELIARVRSQLRRVRASTVGARLEFGDIVLDAGRHKVTRGGDKIDLGPTEYRLLSAMIESPGRVWSRAQLLDRVWGYDSEVESRTVDVHVGRLRKALMQHGAPDPLRTIRGVGYALG